MDINWNDLGLKSAGMVPSMGLKQDQPKLIGTRDYQKNDFFKPDQKDLSYQVYKQFVKTTSLTEVPQDLILSKEYVEFP